MTEQLKRPSRLALTDLPRDRSQHLGDLRKCLVSAFNYCRTYPRKMAMLKAVLKYTYNRVLAFEKEQAEMLAQVAAIKERAADKVARDAIEAEAVELGIDLDMRQTVENLLVELEDAKAELAKTASKDGDTGESEEGVQPPTPDANTAPAPAGDGSTPSTTEKKD